MSQKTLGIVVSHTHWDRAWYLSFQEYRVHLVRLVDSLLEILESDPRYKTFMLDGQTVLLEDYLAIRPQNLERISALVKIGRLQVGPWYTLPDLFLPSGESIIRNLQVGRQLSFAFGEPMPVGYVPDPFGHFAQLPQILNGFGLDSFLFMRGMPKEAKEFGSIFNWVSPDGSAVLAVYLQQGYLACSALGHPSQFGRFDGHRVDIEEARKRIREAVNALSPLQKESVVLLLNGCDHMPPQPELPTVLRLVAASEENLDLEQSSLPDFVSRLKSEAVEHPVFQGDLLGNIDHPILLSVYSTRMYLKQQNHSAQSLLTRVAEPISWAFSKLSYLTQEQSPFLEEAWKLLLRNHAHDNICGCSIDVVHAEDEVRYAECSQIARTLARESMESLLLKGLEPVSRSGSLFSDIFVFNPHPFSVRQKVVASVLFPNPGGEWASPTPEKKLEALSGSGKDLVVSVLQTEPRVARSAFLETTWGRRYSIAFEIEMKPLSYEVVHVFESDTSPIPVENSSSCRLENEHFAVFLGESGICAEEKRTHKVFPSFLSFEYEHDIGDTYSFSATPEGKIWHSQLEDASLNALFPDEMVLRYSLQIPSHYGQNRDSFELKNLEVIVRLRLAASGAIDLVFSYENHAHNGRLRAIFSTGTLVQKFIADGHFRLAEREMEALRAPERSPYPGETQYDTHHQGDFSFVETDKDYRVWVANRGNPEISLVEREGQSFFALTLHRSVGYLSVFGGSIRKCQAGPEVPTPEAQCLRAFVHEVSWGAGLLPRETVMQKALTFSHPLYVSEMPFLPYVNAGTVPRQASFMEFDNPSVVLSALRPLPEKGCALRFYNVSSVPQNLTVRLGIPVSCWAESSLDEIWSAESQRSIENNSITVTILPHEIRTLLLQ